MAFGDFINLARKVDQLLGLEVKYGKVLEKLEREIDDLKHRVTHLEAREEIVIERAKGAAGAAASAVFTASVSDLALRIGRLEERSGGRDRLGPPG